LNIDVLQVIDDSKIIIEWLRDKGRLQVASLMGWMDRINGLKIAFKEIYFTHVYKELNMEAYYLSKRALVKAEGIINYNF
jgi:hypothetical protein